jgi:hypothetical protein|tara:strand:+ start:644 stop:1024 length:381 start_codon:yes stop_codon:yes gene_type:complete
MITYNLLKQLEQSGADLSGLTLSLSGTTTKVKVKLKSGPAQERLKDLKTMFEERHIFNTEEEAKQSGYVCVGDIDAPWTKALNKLAARTDSELLITNENCFAQVGNNTSFTGSYIHKLSAEKACLI